MQEKSHLSKILAWKQRKILFGITFTWNPKKSGADFIETVNEVGISL